MFDVVYYISNIERGWEMLFGPYKITLLKIPLNEFPHKQDLSKKISEEIEKLKKKQTELSRTTKSLEEYFKKTCEERKNLRNLVAEHNKGTYGSKLYWASAQDIGDNKYKVGQVFDRIPQELIPDDDQETFKNL